MTAGKAKDGPAWAAPAAGLVGAALLLTCASVAPGEEFETPRTHSRSPYVHRITTYDDTGEIISAADVPARPYSPRVTCGKCHDYAVISGGWHFNAPDVGVPPGRPGEPWILYDPLTATQLPVSYRRWPGLFTPAEAGLRPWEFVLTFGRHMPGGGPGEKYTALMRDPTSRWRVSGKLEIDCMTCHSGSPEYDPAEWAAQIRSQNLRWAATAAGALAVVRGSAQHMPRDYAPEFPPEPDPDHPERAGPKVLYNKSLFDANDRVFFDIPQQPPAARCYACHTVRRVGPKATPTWRTDEDVHLAAGLTCASCHRQGLDHAMTRGYETEKSQHNRLAAATLSCRGCHLGDESAPIPTAWGGRLSAPRPKHAGLPGAHLEKLTCTACHSGPWPQQTTGRAQTSMAHGLGLSTKQRTSGTPPYIASPVFVRQADGTVAPCRMVWPAFWGRLTGRRIVPLPPRAVAAACKNVLGEKAAPAEDGRPPPFSPKQVAAVLKLLDADPAGNGRPVYVSGGKVYRRGEQGGLVATIHPAARPYAWPLAHDVRPATQSLGSRDCTDCHSTDAPLFFGRVLAESPLRIGEPVSHPMSEFADQDAAYHRYFALSFAFRPWLKVTGFAASGVLAAVLLSYGLLGLGGLLRILSGRKG